MCTRKSLLVVAGTAVLVALIAVSASAFSTQETYLTFSGPVALPGVTLSPGTYLFRSPTAQDRNVVQVLRRDKGRLTPYFMGMTQPVERPTLNGGSLVSLGEAAPGRPTPIKAWFPIDSRMGHAFIYER
jgi:hypothetical protein